MTEALLFDALRTPRAKGKSSGAFYGVKPIDLLASALRALQERNELDTSRVDDLIAGCVTPIGDQGGNIAKAALLYSGWANEVAGLQLNRYCASGLEAVNLAAARIRAGFDQLIVAGGLECMSCVPMESDGGPLLFDPEVLHRTGYIPQGVAADLIATINGYEREILDQYALQSQQRAAAAQAAGYFDRSIIPIHDQNGLLLLDRDEYLRPQTTLESLAGLRPAFTHYGEQGFDAIALRRYPEVERIHHHHTAGNSSGIVDGAALVLLGSAAIGQQLGLQARAKVRAAAVIGSEPTIMLNGPGPASRKVLAQAGMEISDIDLWEVNEAFAAVALQLQRSFELDPDRVNVNGGAIALGHPLGATGAMLLGTLLDELERRDLQTGLVTLCVGGGMGVATIIERI
ncbi:MAG: acetyl-CoA C-acetyltransferase [Bacteroidota bacterium]